MKRLLTSIVVLISTTAVAQNVGIGTTAPSYILDVNGRMRLRDNGATAGVWFNKANNTEAAFAGMINDSTIGFFGNGTVGNWRVGIDVKNAMIGIGNIDPTAPLSFSNNIGDKMDVYYASPTSRYGIGLQAGLLQMYTAGVNNDIAFGYGASALANFTELVRFKGNGNVGIGTNTPSRKLDIKNDRIRFTGSLAADFTQGIEFTKANGSALAGFVGTYNDTLMGLYGYAGAGWKFIFDEKNGHLGLEGNVTPTAPLSFDEVLGKKISLYHGATGDAGFGVYASELRMHSDYDGADITFGYDRYSLGFVERMRLTANGRLGINTNAPAATLEVNTFSGTAGGILVATPLQSIVVRPMSLGSEIGPITNHKLHLLTNGSKRVTINESGLVGIGTNVTPAYLLDVAGRMRVRADANTAGIWFNKADNSAEASFIGQYTDTKFGIFSNGWKFAVDATDGTVYCGSANLDAESLVNATGYKLKVFGKIISEEVRVQLKGAWPDYVFSDEYKLKPLSEVEKFIKQNKHLEGFNTAAVIEKQGADLGDTQRKLLEKVEELTLYIIDLKKEVETLKNEKNK